jgi:hypothetical protein
MDWNRKSNLEKIIRIEYLIEKYLLDKFKTNKLMDDTLKLTIKENILYLLIKYYLLYFF